MNKRLRAIVCAAAIAVSAFALAPLQAEASTKTYELNQTVKAYYTSADASKNTSAVSEYKTGEYYIYKEANGMINISKVKGQPGAWINPKDNKAVEKFNLVREVNAYFTSMDAKNREEAVKKYGAGEYLVYKVASGMVNITKDIKTPGAWINPEDNTIYKPCDGDIYLSENSLVYMTANDAITKEDSVKIYGAGEYFIYKTVPGAINITKVKGTPGAWIKTDNVAVCPLPAPSKPGTPAPSKPGTPAPSKPETPAPAKPGVPTPVKPISGNEVPANAEASAGVIPHYFKTLEEALTTYPGSFPMAEGGLFIVYTNQAGLVEHVYNSFQDAKTAYPNSKPLADGGKFYVWTNELPLEKYEFSSVEEATKYFPGVKPLAENGKFYVWNTARPLIKNEFATYAEAKKAYPDREPMAENGKFYVYSTFKPAMEKPVVEKATPSKVKSNKIEAPKFNPAPGEKEVAPAPVAPKDPIQMGDGNLFVVPTTTEAPAKEPVVTTSIYQNKPIKFGDDNAFDEPATTEAPAEEPVVTTSIYQNKPIQLGDGALINDAPAEDAPAEDASAE